MPTGVYRYQYEHIQAPFERQARLRTNRSIILCRRRQRNSALLSILTSVGLLNGLVGSLRAGSGIVRRCLSENI